MRHRPGTVRGQGRIGLTLGLRCRGCEIPARFRHDLFGGWSSGANKPSVVFAGDSITVLATPAIHQLLDPGYDVDVLAVIGIRINQSLPALQSALRSHPDAVVVNLGTNDALQGGVHPTGYRVGTG